MIQLPNAASFLVTEDCNLRCEYCLTEDTMITMMDFSKKPIKDIRKGDMILGFDEYAEQKRLHRKVYPSRVLQLHSREAKVLKVTLDTGDSINITENHAILSTRGNCQYAWRPARRYKVGQKVMTMPNVKYPEVNTQDKNYIIGYFVGMMRGDGSIKQYIDAKGYDMYRVRLAVKDTEIITRMKGYFEYLGIAYTTHDFKVSNKLDLNEEAIFCKSRNSYNEINNIINNNLGVNNSTEYYCGFLAGIYDSEGHIDVERGVIRISNSDTALIGEIKRALDALGFNYNTEGPYKPAKANVYVIRILAGRTYDHLRFVLTVKPAILRKGLSVFYNKSILTNATITSIKSIGTQQVYNIGTECRTYIANNFAVHNCFEKHRNPKTMSVEVVHKAVDLLCENAIKSEQKEINVMLFGGEPLLVPDILEEIFSYGFNTCRKHGLTFTSSLVTNATIFNDEVERVLKTYKKICNLHVQLSVDGIQEVQDKYRRTRDGKGSFHLVERNIPKFKQVFAGNGGSLSIHGCMGKDTLPYLYQNYLFFREEWDIPMIWFLPIHSEEWRDEDVDIYREGLTKIADYILERCRREGSTDEVSYYAPIDRCLRPDSRPNAPCGAGKSFVTITADGLISPCHHIYFNDPEGHTLLGDVWKGIDEGKRKLFAYYDNEDISCHKEYPDCDAYHCYRCIADNWVINGSILSQIRGPRCEMSHVERQIQLRVREELETMGLKDNKMVDTRPGNNPDNPDCLCDLGGPGMNEGCDLVNYGDPCECNARAFSEEGSDICIPTNKDICEDRPSEKQEEPCKCESNEDTNEVFAFALKSILEELKYIKEIQEVILKKLL